MCEGIIAALPVPASDLESKVPSRTTLFFMSDHSTAAPQDENQLMHERREKLKAIRQHQTEGKGVAFPNDFAPSHKAEQLFTEYDALSTETLASMAVTAR